MNRKLQNPIFKNINNELVKVCPICKKELLLNKYPKHKNSLHGISRGRCLECRRDKWHIDRDKHLLASKKWREAIPEYVKNFHIQYQKANKEKLSQYIKKYREEHRESLRLKKQQRRNTPEGRKARALYHKNSSINPNYVIGRRLRGRLYKALRGVKKSNTIGNIENLIGCSLPFLFEYIKSQFTENMTWEMLMNGDIHIDHKIPVACFSDLTKEYLQKRCFHYTNLQPLLESDNCSKANQDKLLASYLTFY